MRTEFGRIAALAAAQQALVCPLFCACVLTSIKAAE